MADQIDRLNAALADRYAIERELGRGGMATVYLAEDLKHHRHVAIKVLDPELARTLGSERFLRRDLGESRAVLANTEPLPQVLTPSMEALRLLRDGYAFQVSIQPRQAIPHYREALLLDPEFSAAHVALLNSYNNVGEPESALVHAPTHLKLGRLQAENGDTAKALEHYSAFVETFTDPDPEYEWMVEEARSEVERLGQGR